MVHRLLDGVIGRKLSNGVFDLATSKAQQIADAIALLTEHGKVVKDATDAVPTADNTVINEIRDLVSKSDVLPDGYTLTDVGVYDGKHKEKVSIWHNRHNSNEKFESYVGRSNLARSTKPGGGGKRSAMVYDGVKYKPGTSIKSYKAICDKYGIALNGASGNVKLLKALTDGVVTIEAIRNDLNEVTSEE